MTPERWKQIEKLYHSALKLEPGQRTAFLKEGCTGDEDLRREVESLLAHEPQAESFIEAPALQVTAEVIAEKQVQPLVGRQFGPYKILSPLGTGGMGEVYKAHDSRLDRIDALKILPTEFASDPERMQRFVREARAASALKHPNVATIHEMGEFEGLQFIAMEYVEGETLSARIHASRNPSPGLRPPSPLGRGNQKNIETLPSPFGRGAGGEGQRGQPLETDEILEIGLQAADALDEAHSQGITHRDIKPGNIMLTKRGQVKVLDFGLAKITRPERAAGSSYISTLVKTEAGVVMGTVQYMSPEQVLGKEVDHRTDIFSLGVVLYEMTTGRLPFTGTSTSETMDRILHGEPEAIARFNYNVPGELERIVRKCLEKDRERRYQSARDLLIDLKNLKRDSDSGKAAEVLPRREKWEERLTFRRRRLTASLAVALALVAAVAGAAWLLLRSQNATPPSRSDYVQLTNLPDSATQPALSPDGRMLTFIRGPGTFATRGQIYVKMLPSGEPVQLTRDSLYKMSPVFSPDGSRIAYTVVEEGNKWNTWEVPVLGGEPRRWLPNASGLVWIGPNRLLFSEIKGGFIHMAIVTAAASRAEARDIYVPAQEAGMGHRSYLSPDGKWVLVVEMDEKPLWLPCRLVPFDASSSGRPVGPLAAPCTYVAWSPDGRWMYFSAHAGDGFHTWRQPFPDGKPEQITSGPTEEEGLAVAADGHSFVTSVGLRQRSIWYHDASGDRQVSLEGYAYGPCLSTDARKVCYRIRKGAAPAFGASELWMAELDSGRNEPLLPGFSVTGYDVSRDGRVVASVLGSDGKTRLWLAWIDRRSPPQQIPASEGDSPLFGASGEIFFRSSEGSSMFLFRIRRDGTDRQKVTSQPVQEVHSVSPDDQWVASFSPVPGAEAVSAMFVQRVGGGTSIRIYDGPCRVHWALDGKFLYLGVSASFLGAGATGRTFVLPTRPGMLLPDIPADGFHSEAQIATVAGVRIIEAADVALGPTPDVYAYSRETVQRNLYRIPMP